MCIKEKESQQPHAVGKLCQSLQQVKLNQGDGLIEIDGIHFKEHEIFKSMYKCFENNLEEKKGILLKKNVERNKQECQSQLNKSIKKMVPRLDTIEELMENVLALNIPKLMPPSEIDPEMWQKAKSEKVKINSNVITKSKYCLFEI